MNPLTRSLMTAVAAGTAGWTVADASPDLRSLFPYHERIIAIDNVCAWPALTRLPNGELSALIWSQPNHGTTAGAAEIWNSADDGRTWRRMGVPVPNEPPGNRMNVAAGLASDGTYVALVSGWDLKPNPATEVHPGTVYGSPVKTVPATSRDGGRTWVQHPGLEATQRLMIPFGRVAPVEGDTLGVMIYGAGAFFYTSSDHGASWSQRSSLTGDVAADFRSSKNTETTWLKLQNGDLYAASRTRGDGERLAGYRSRDKGHSWQFEEYLTLAGQAPGHLVELPDGRILLTYGVRNPGGFAISVRIANAVAKAWSEPLFLVELEASHRDLGYPSTVVTKGDLLVTAYYSRGVVAHNRYHMGVVRWKAPPIPVRKRDLRAQEAAAAAKAAKKE